MSAAEARPDPPAAAITWVVPETGESFDNYTDYVARLVELRQPKTDLVLTAPGAIPQPDVGAPAKPANDADRDSGIVTIDISPDDALQRLAGCEFHAIGLTVAERTHRLQIEVDTLLAQAADDGLGAELIADLRRMRTGLRRLAEPRSDPNVIQREGAPDRDESILHLHQRLSKLEATLDVSPLSQAEALLEELEDRVSLLSESRLDSISVKSKQALAELQRLSQGASTNVDRAAFDELRDAVRRWDDVSRALPLVIDRLIAIKNLHEHGANVMARVAAVEQAAHVSAEKLRQSAGAVANIERTLGDNLRVMEANCAVLAERLDKLERTRG